MKILQLVKYFDPYNGGVESVVKNIINGINKLETNTNFTVYSNNHKYNFFKEIKSKFGLTIIKERTLFFFKSQPINLRYPLLRKLIMNNDIIHHHYPFPTLELVLLKNLKHTKNKKIVITWHANINNSRWGWIERFYNPIIENILNRADYIVVTSPQLYEASSILKRHHEKIKVIPLSYDPKFESLMSKEFPKNRIFELLFVGKLRQYKGVDYLIKSIEKLNVNLTIVGNGEELDKLKGLVKELNISKKVVFLTDVNDQQLIEIYKKSDLFILPSINEAEAFGVVQLEAMANGLPVINTNLESGVPFVSLNGQTGLTVSPKNIVELTAAIEKIISNQQLFEDFSSNSLERIKLFSREKMTQSYLDLYKEII
jgi:rhamnosyl/mannosyltransferase